MIESILFGVFVVAVGMILFWSMMNEGSRSGKDISHGLFGVKPDLPKDQKKSGH